VPPRHHQIPSDCFGARVRVGGRSHIDSSLTQARRWSATIQSAVLRSCRFGHSKCPDDDTVWYSSLTSTPAVAASGLARQGARGRRAAQGRAAAAPAARLARSRSRQSRDASREADAVPTLSRTDRHGGQILTRSGAMETPRQDAPRPRRWRTRAPAKQTRLASASPRPHFATGHPRIEAQTHLDQRRGISATRCAVTRSQLPARSNTPCAWPEIPASPPSTTSPGRPQAARRRTKSPAATSSGSGVRPGYVVRGALRHSRALRNEAAGSVSSELTGTICGHRGLS